MGLALAGGRGWGEGVRGARGRRNWLEGMLLSMSLRSSVGARAGVVLSMKPRYRSDAVASKRVQLKVMLLVNVLMST